MSEELMLAGRRKHPVKSVVAKLFRIQLSIRELLALIVIVALATVVWFERVKVARMQAYIDRFPTGQLEVMLKPFRKTFGTWAPYIPVSAILHLRNDQRHKGAGLAHIRLISPATGQTLSEIQSGLTPNLMGAGMNGNLPLKENLEPGFYPILAEVYDGGIRPTFRAITLVEIIER